MQQQRHFPDASRLSVLAATILLAYTLARFVDLPERDLSVQLPGVFLPFKINLHTAVALLVAGLTATGANWLLSQHPHATGHSLVEHWLLPALSALVLGVPLLSMPFGAPWLAGFAIGSAMLMLVLLAEYITIDAEDPRQPAAAAGLAALSFALFLTLAIGLRYAGSRLYALLPPLSMAAALVSARTLHLRLAGRWQLLPALVIGLLSAQFAAGLHYLPLSPSAFGLLLTGLTYAATSLVGSIIEQTPLRRALIEPGLVLAILTLAAFWV